MVLEQIYTRSVFFVLPFLNAVLQNVLRHLLKYHVRSLPNTELRVLNSFHIYCHVRRHFLLERGLDPFWEIVDQTGASS